MLATSKLKVGINLQDVNLLIVFLLRMSLYLHKGYRCTAYEVCFHFRISSSCDLLWCHVNCQQSNSCRKIIIFNRESKTQFPGCIVLFMTSRPEEAHPKLPRNTTQKDSAATNDALITISELHVLASICCSIRIQGALADTELLVDLNMRPSWVWLQILFIVIRSKELVCFGVSFEVPQGQRVVLQTVLGYAHSFAPDL